MLPYAPWLCWLVPTIGALLTPLLAIIHRKLRDYAPVVFTGASVVFSLSMIVDVSSGNAVDWLSGEVLGSIPFDWQIPWVSSLGLNLGVLVDPLNVLMAVVVSSIGFLVTIFSVGYMRGKPSLTRFWFLIQLFIAGYIVLVMADNFLLMFVGWEIVGVCCTFLAAFWHEDPHKAQAGIKTNMTLRVGDICLLTSILVIYAYSGTLNILELQQNAGWMLQLSRSGLLLITTLMFFGGAIGKSAQFPLLGWLPDMLAASPSSFNALTECLAGIFLIARVLPIFYQASALGLSEMVFFFSTVAWVGAFSALLGALIAMAQRNIHRVLAYSILSVIGYMLAALGIAGLMSNLSSGYLAGTFLLTVDAFVSGLLFLTAAFISYSVGSDDLHHMGGIKSKLAHRGMEVGVLALIGLPPLSGFWVMNWIQSLALDLAGEASRNGQQMLMISSVGLFTILIIAGGITAFYGVRIFGLVFGKGTHNPKARRKLTKAPALMRISLIAMVVVTAIIDFSVPILIPAFNRFLLPTSPQLFFGNIFDVILYIVPSISTLFSTVALAIGGYCAYRLYMTHQADPVKIVEEHQFLRKAHNFLRNGCYIDKFFNKIADGTKAFSKVMFKRLERYIDSLNYVAARFIARLSKAAYKYPELKGFDALNYFIANFITRLSQHFRSIHTGVLSYNMLMAFAGAALLIFLLFLFGGYVP